MLSLAGALHRLQSRIRGGLSRVSLRSDLDRTAAHWGREAGQWRVGRGLHWTEQALVQQRLNLKASGDPATDAYGHFVSRHLDGRLPVTCSLTLGCGDGVLERGLAQYGLSRLYEGVDVSREALRRADELAPRTDGASFRYRYTDLNHADLPPGRYDVVFGANVVHHVERLEHLFAEVKRALRPGGYLHLNEYVGPARFQWTDRQLEAINGLLAALPRRYRVSVADGRSVKRRLTRPTVAEVKAVDPSEAARSDEIVPLLGGQFELVEVRPLGGAVLHPLLDSIAGNFDPHSEDDRRWLEWLFQAEDALMASGDVGSDFAVIVARNP
jgi:SAM-dependent methyltransferase